MRSASFALFVLAYYQLAGLGVNIGYHRVLSHRSLKLPLWLERALVSIGLPAGTPIQWAGNHRSDRWYAWLSRPWPYALVMHLHAAIPMLVAWRMWGGAGIAGAWIVIAALYNLGDAIDSVSHLYGSTLPGQDDASRNSRLMGLLTLGEGWHANHHRFPWSARHGLLKGQWDWTWQVIRALRAAGLARNVRLPRDVPDQETSGGPSTCM